jgi:DNA-directed RNA polymerase sigma subunit (sigma70/sigma32)
MYLRDVRRYQRLDAAHEAALVARLSEEVDSGDTSARDELICHHLGLVIAMARKFNHRGLDLLDLIEEGNLGMLVALQKFDPARGLRFSTYAAWWIRYYLQTAIATQVPIVRPPLRAQASRLGISGAKAMRCLMTRPMTRLSMRKVSKDAKQKPKLKTKVKAKLKAKMKAKALALWLPPAARRQATPRARKPPPW